MRDDKLALSFQKLGNALARLKETVEADPEEHFFAVDATVQRFEFTFELFWKSMKRLLEEEGFDVRSPRQTLKHAFQQGWLDDQQLWLNMLDDRNRTVHAYDEAMAQAIYERVLRYQPELQRIYDLLMTEFAEVLRPPPPPA